MKPAPSRRAADPPDGEPVLSDDDVRSLVRLLGRVVSAPGGQNEKRRMVMEGLCGIIGADAWAWSLVHMESGRAPMQVALLHDGIPEDRFASYVAALEHPGAQIVLESYVGAAIGRATPLTRRDEQILPPGTLHYNTVVDGLWERAGFDSFVLTAWPLQAGGFSGIGVYRKVGKPGFGPRETRIAHIVLTEIPWLHEDGWGDERGDTLSRLPRRQREILQLLVQGRSRKEIAVDLALSLNTVHGYVRDIYRHFGVNSHATLMRRFSRGDGGDDA